MSHVDDLKQLAEMRDAGDITQAEYERIEADILSELNQVGADSSTKGTTPAGWYNVPQGFHTHQAYGDGENSTSLIHSMK